MYTKYTQLLLVLRSSDFVHALNIVHDRNKPTDMNLKICPSEHFTPTFLLKEKIVPPVSNFVKVPVIGHNMAEAVPVETRMWIIYYN